MKKAFVYFLKTLKTSYHLIFFAVSIICIFLLAYFLGFQYLQSVIGNDSMYHLSNIFWFNKYFPNIPYWYPLQNGGVVPVWGYPQLAYFIVIIFHRLTNISPVGLYQIIGFLSVPFTALGLYIYAWLRLKNQIMALIASVFYLLAPIAWVWLFDWGFYTESVSYIFIFPALIFYDYFLSGVLRKTLSLTYRLAFIVAVFFCALAFLTHPLTLFIIFTIVALSTVFQVLDHQRRPFLQTAAYIIIPVSLLVVSTLLSISFLLFDFYGYASRIPSVPSADAQKVFLDSYPTPVTSLLGLSLIPVTDINYTHRNIVVPLLLWIPAIAGLLLSLIYSRKVLALGILAFLPVVYFKWPILAWYSITLIPFGGYIFQHRAVLIFIRILLPVIAAFGIWASVKFIIDIPTFWIKKGKAYTVRRIMTVSAAGILSLIIAGFLIIYLADKPDNIWSASELRYGPEAIDSRDPFRTVRQQDMCKRSEDDKLRPKACNNPVIKRNFDVDQIITICKNETVKPAICGSLLKSNTVQGEVDAFNETCSQGKFPQFCRYVRRIDWSRLIASLSDSGNWPMPRLSSGFDIPRNRFSNFIDTHKNDKLLRIEVSPALGGVVQSLNMTSEISQINLYAITLSLLEPYWGYQQQVYYGPGKNSTDLYNMAKWFGTKYVFLEELLNPLDKYNNDQQNWERVDDAGIWHFIPSPEMYSWTLEKPAVLVIGSHKVRAYEPFFRVAVNGGYGYDDGLLVQGKEKIDAYNLTELKKFNILVLFGYSYNNKNKAFKLLDQYVKEGGRVFISTGWQYTDKDWALEKTPDFFPVNSLRWSADQNRDGNYGIEDIEVAGSVDNTLLPPLAWGDKPWGVSVPQGIKDWAKTVVSYDGNPLVVAGKYGEGKIIWSGLNFPGHIHAFGYIEEEITLFNNILRWLGHGVDGEEEMQTKKVTVTRNHPDRVEFHFSDSASKPSLLYWRESEYPNWHATLVQAGKQNEPVTIYRAGPGFMLMRLPVLQRGSTVILEFNPGLRSFFGGFLSLLTILVMLAYAVFGGKIFNFFVRPVRNAGKKTMLSARHSMKHVWGKVAEDEEEY